MVGEWGAEMRNEVMVGTGIIVLVMATITEIVPVPTRIVAVTSTMSRTIPPTTGAPGAGLAAPLAPGPPSPGGELGGGNRPPGPDPLSPLCLPASRR